MARNGLQFENRIATLPLGGVDMIDRNETQSEVKTDRQIDDESQVPGDEAQQELHDGLGRLALYTAPLMIGLLTSQPAASASVMASDRRLKRDIRRVGHLANGLGLYRYRYLWSATPYVGVMAQEVVELDPQAVVRGTDGYLRVDYARLGLRLKTWDEWAAA